MQKEGSILRVYEYYIGMFCANMNLSTVWAQFSHIIIKCVGVKKKSYMDADASCTKSNGNASFLNLNGESSSWIVKMFNIACYKELVGTIYWKNNPNQNMAYA